MPATMYDYRDRSETVDLSTLTDLTTGSIVQDEYQFCWELRPDGLWYTANHEYGFTSHELDWVGPVWLLARG